MMTVRGGRNPCQMAKGFWDFSIRRTIAEEQGDVNPKGSLLKAVKDLSAF